MTRIVEINGLDELDALAVDWRSLWASTPAANFFQSLPWLRLYWRSFAEQQRLRVFVVLQDGATVGIVPLVERRESTRLGSVCVLTYPLHDWGSFYGPIAVQPADVLGQVLRRLRREPHPRWDLLDLRWSRETQLGELQAQVAEAGFAACSGVWKTTCAVDLPGEWRAYLAGRAAKLRGNIGRCRRRLEAAGDLELLSHRPAGEQAGQDNPRWDLYDSCVAVAANSWQASSQSGTTLTHPRVAAFLRECHAEAARQGMLDMHVLRLDEHTIGFAYNYHAQGEVTAMRTGYDREFRSYGVGTVMWSHLIQSSVGHGDHLLDLGPDSPEIKRGWTTRQLPVKRVTVYRTWKAKLLQWKRGGGWRVEGRG